MHFEKHDMRGHHYNWDNEVSKGIFTGSPTRRFFNRFNGDQVLFIINFYASAFERSSLQECLKIEDLITHQLPPEAKSEISVFNWLRAAT